MIEEVKVKTHLIITNIQDEYHFKWCGKIYDAKPRFQNDKFVFSIVGTNERVEVNTLDLTEVEQCAKKMTCPHGREAFTSAKAYIYIQEEDGNELFLGTLTHNHIKQYNQMYDKVGYM